MAWLNLLIAGLFEIAWAIGMKYSEGFTKPLISVLTVTGMILSFYFLSNALKEIPLGTGYAIWTGIGAIGTTALGMILFNEPRDVFRLVCIGLIVSGIVGLKFFAK